MYNNRANTTKHSTQVMMATSVFSARDALQIVTNYGASPQKAKGISETVRHWNEQALDC